VEVFAPPAKRATPIILCITKLLQSQTTRRIIRLEIPNMQQFKVGDKVQWSSQAQGSMATKRGTVIGVIPPGGHWAFGPEHGYVSHYGGGDMRNHESYLVRVPAKGKGKPHLYWPRVSALKAVEP
jgi:hypothetical protein